MAVLARSLNHLFRHFRDDSVDEIILAGQNNGVWLATTLLWLFADDACLFVDGTLVRGLFSAKLKVKLLPSRSDPWNLVVCKGGKSSAGYMYPYDREQEDILKRLPLSATRSYLNQHFWSAFSDHMMRANAMVMTGRIAGALILLRRWT